MGRTTQTQDWVYFSFLLFPDRQTVFIESAAFFFFVLVQQRHSFWLHRNGAFGMSMLFSVWIIVRGRYLCKESQGQAVCESENVWFRHGWHRNVCSTFTVPTCCETFERSHKGHAAVHFGCWFWGTIKHPMKRYLVLMLNGCTDLHLRVHVHGTEQQQLEWIMYEDEDRAKLLRPPSKWVPFGSVLGSRALHHSRSSQPPLPCSIMQEVLKYIHVAQHVFSDSFCQGTGLPNVFLSCIFLSGAPHNLTLQFDCVYVCRRNAPARRNSTASNGSSKPAHGPSTPNTVSLPLNAVVQHAFLME